MTKKPLTSSSWSFRATIVLIIGLALLLQAFLVESIATQHVSSHLQFVNIIADMLHKSSTSTRTSLYFVLSSTVSACLGTRPWAVYLEEGLYTYTFSPNAHSARRYFAVPPDPYNRYHITIWLFKFSTECFVAADSESTVVAEGWGIEDRTGKEGMT